MKLKELYLDNGYLNMGEVFSLPYPFIFIIGGRGTGKTYGALTTCVDNNIRFLYLRRTQVQADIISTTEMSPFKVINSDRGWNIVPGKISKYVKGFYEGYEEDGKLKIDTDSLYGYTASLSTFSNIRGFDGCDIDIILFDEFVPQKGDRVLSYEGDSFFNMIETINRNREINGLGAVKTVCMANSSDIANPIFVQLGLVSKLWKRKSKGDFFITDDARGFCVIFPIRSAISHLKAETALYRLTEGTDFYNSAIENDFSYNIPTKVHSYPLKEYRPIVQVGELCIYKHKGNREFYVSSHVSGSPVYYGTSPKQLAVFRNRHSFLRTAVMLDRVTYEDYSCEVLFDKYMEMVYI